MEDKLSIKNILRKRKISNILEKVTLDETEQKLLDLFDNNFSLNKIKYYEYLEALIYPKDNELLLREIGLDLRESEEYIKEYFLYEHGIVVKYLMII